MEARVSMALRSFDAAAVMRGCRHPHPGPSATYAACPALHYSLFTPDRVGRSRRRQRRPRSAAQTRQEHGELPSSEACQAAHAEGLLLEGLCCRPLSSTLHAPAWALIFHWPLLTIQLGPGRAHSLHALRSSGSCSRLKRRPPPTPATLRSKQSTSKGSTHKTRRLCCGGNRNEKFSNVSALLFLLS